MGAKRKKSDPRTAIRKLEDVIERLGVVLQDVEALTAANYEMRKTIKSKNYTGGVKKR